MPASAKASFSSFPRRPYERMTRQIFLVSGLLTNEHDCRCRRPFSKNRLGCVPPQIARLAVAGGFAKLVDRS
jgi:hypothetical protein